MFSFLLLGAPQILKEGRAIQLPRRKNRALLFYVAAHDKPLTREHLLNFFFPDHERAAAQPILRTMLYDLRKQLDDALIVQDEMLALAPDTVVDARAFQSNLQLPTSNLQSLTSSLQLYRGDFLDGLTLPDEPQFDDWVNRERERYRALATRGWNKLAALYEDAREYGGALDALERAVALDALNEEIQRAAMRVQYFRGDRAGAIRRFEQLQNRLNEELGVPPLPETRALYDAIVTDALVADSRWQMADSRPLDFARGKLPTEDGGRRVRKSITKPLTSTTQSLLPFAGREAELRAMEQGAAAGKIIWIEGEPGIGKTRLAEEYVARQREDTLVLSGAAHELEASLPYQPLLDALRTLVNQWQGDELREQLQLAPVWLAELVRLVPEL